MARHDISTLNARLFDLLDQVTDPVDLTGARTDDPEEIARLLQRAAAGVQVARAIISVGELALDAARLRADYPDSRAPDVLGLAGPDGGAAGKGR